MARHTLDTHVGYIRSKYAKSLGTIKYALGDINLRSSKSTTSTKNIVSAIAAGEPVRILKNSGNWAHVFYQNVTGYVLKRDLGKRKADYFLKLNTDIIDNRDVSYISYSCRSAGTGLDDGVIPELEITYSFKVVKNHPFEIIFYYYATEQDALNAKRGINETVIFPDWFRNFWHEGTLIVEKRGFGLSEYPESKAEIALSHKITTNLEKRYGEPLSFSFAD